MNTHSSRNPVSWTPPPLRYSARFAGITWSVYENGKAILHNLDEWQARAIVAILSA